MIDLYGGGPVGLSTLSVNIGEETETVEDMYEPYLIQKGFIKRTPRGRIATPFAYAHFGYDYLASLNRLLSFVSRETFVLI